MKKQDMTALVRFLCGMSFVLFLAGCSYVEPYIPDFGSSPSIRTRGKVTAEASGVIRTARTQIGKPYRWGGDSPSEGYDCSGLVWWVYRRNGVSVPRVSWQQYSAGRFVDKDDIRPGDLIFFRITTGKSLHVGIVTERGTFVHSPSSGSRVMESSLNNMFWREHYVGARRLL